MGYIGFVILNIFMTSIFLLWVHSHRWKKEENDTWEGYSLPRFIYILMGIFCWVPLMFAINILIMFFKLSEDDSYYYIEPKPFFAKLYNFLKARL